MRRRLVVASLVWICGPALAQTPVAPLSARPGDAVLIRRCEGNISIEQTYALARHWIDAWNSTSGDTVMALYTPDFEFRGPGIITSARRADPSGVLHGQADNRLRWFDPAAKGVKGVGSFRLIDAFAGVRSIAVHYNGANGRPVTEIMEYTPDCKIERSNALYGALLPGTATAPPAAAAPSNGG
jgi:hypothetical protein